MMEKTTAMRLAKSLVMRLAILLLISQIDQHYTNNLHNLHDYYHFVNNNHHLSWRDPKYFSCHLDLETTQMINKLHRSCIFLRMNSQFRQIEGHNFHTYIICHGVTQNT